MVGGKQWSATQSCCLTSASHNLSAITNKYTGNKTLQKGAKRIPSIVAFSGTIMMTWLELYHHIYGLTDDQAGTEDTACWKHLGLSHPSQSRCQKFREALLGSRKFALNSDCGCVILQVTCSAFSDQVKAAGVASNSTPHKYREVRIVYRSGSASRCSQFWWGFWHIISYIVRRDW